MFTFLRNAYLLFLKWSFQNARFKYASFQNANFQNTCFQNARFLKKFIQTYPKRIILLSPILIEI